MQRAVAEAEAKDAPARATTIGVDGEPFGRDNRPDSPTSTPSTAIRSRITVGSAPHLKGYTARKFRALGDGGGESIRVQEGANVYHLMLSRRR